MGVQNKTDLIRALQDQRFEDIENTPESAWVDFKQAIYEPLPVKLLRLSEKGKFEFAKDVAAFANDQGGCLVLGVKEKTEPAKGVAVAGQINPLKVASVDITHYKDVLRAQLYPVPRGVTFTWYHTNTEETEGLLVVDIPKGTEGFHIVRNLIDESGARLQNVGIPRRNDDRTDWVPAEMVHSLIYFAAGAATSSLSKKAHAESAAKTRNSIIAIHEWEDEPVVIFQVVPTGDEKPLRNFYDQIRRALDEPKSIRTMGFGLGALGRITDTVDGAFVIDGSRGATARLDPNGLFTVALTATPDLAGWGMNKDRHEGEGAVLNATVLIEMAFEICRFVADVLTQYGMREWEYVLDARNLKKAGVTLYRGQPGRGVLLSEQVRASSNDWRRVVAATSDPAADAFNIATELYALFALPETSIPYVSGQKISAERLIDLDKNPW